jgi:hypothetical protein
VGRGRVNVDEWNKKVAAIPKCVKRKKNGRKEQVIIDRENAADFENAAYHIPVCTVRYKRFLRRISL